jgi:MFS family permease
MTPFRVRSFRFQWPADLATSWAFEMETLILGWYVLVETGSVLMLTVFASLQYVGTLLSPMFGVVGDRIGQRNVLSVMRATYATLATVLMLFALTDVLTPVHVLIVAAAAGLVRPSDLGVRLALVGETMPRAHWMAAMSLQRITHDSARIAGALSGAGLVALLGMGTAYGMVASLYAISLLLTLKTGGARRASEPAASTSPWRDLREGLAYVWATPQLLAMMCLAFLLNLTAFPLFIGLLPYVAKEVYGAEQTTLGYMVAAGSLGAMLGSLVLSRHGAFFNPARLMIVCAAAWLGVLLVFAQIRDPAAGIVVLAFAGFAQSMGLVPMATLLLRNAGEQFRGRIMGIRMLAIYGNLPGLLIAGPLIANFGYAATATLYCALGLAFTLVIALHWRTALWRVPVQTRVQQRANDLKGD